jgi:hypothetical protein
VNLSGVWDWDFFWNCFGFILKTVASFLMVVIAILGVGMLLKVVIDAVRSSRN